MHGRVIRSIKTNAHDPDTLLVTSEPTVVHVLEAMGGGTSRHMVDLVAATEGFKHVVVAPTQRFEDITDETMIPRLREAGFDVHIIDMRRTPTHPDNAKAIIRGWRLIQSLQPSIVHGHSHIGGAVARLASLPAHGVPRVWTPHGLHHSRGIMAVERAFNRLTSATVAVSESEADLLRSRGVVRSGKLYTIPNGIDPKPLGGELGQLREQFGIAQDAPLVGTLGRLADQKAPLDFVAACQILHERFPQAHFIQIGDGPLADAVTRAAANMIDAGVFHQVSYLKDASAYMADLDVFLLNSLFEGGPYAPLEAMREGVPVVLTDVVGSHDVVEDGVTGYLVPFADVRAAADAVGSLLSSPERRRQFAAEASRRLNDRFSAQRMGAAHREMYEQLLSHRVSA
jgi:glycosyltransferase involved in cell wall biosynthesis